MKTWNTPAIAELGVEETADGIINIGWEGPLNLIFGDRKSKEEKKDPVTPVDPVPVKPVIPETQLS